MSDNFRVDTTSAIRISARSAWTTLIVVTVISILAFVDRSLFALLVEPIKAQLSLSDTELSVLLGPAFSICTVLFALPLGWLGDRYSRRLILGVCMLIWSSGMLVVATSSTFNHLVFGRMVIGLGEAGLSPLTFAILADVMPPQRRAISAAILSTSNNIGGAIALSVGGILMASITGYASRLGIHTTLLPWQLVTLVIGAPGLLAVVLIALISEPPRSHASVAAASQDPSESFAAFLKQNYRCMLLLLLGFGGELVCLTTVMAWTPAYMSRHFHWQPEQYGPLLGLMGLISGVGALGGGAVQDWLRSKNVSNPYVRSYFWLLVAGLPFFATAFFLSDARIFIAISPFMQLILLSALTFLIPTLQSITPPQFVGRVLGGYFSILTLIGSFGPVGAGLLTDRVFKDPSKLNYSIVIILFAGLTLTLVSLRAFLVVSESRNKAGAATSGNVSSSKPILASLSTPEGTNV